jgi:hypothetical protein
MVIAGRTGSDAAWQKLDELIRDAELEVVAHDRRLAQIAREAFLRFGKGRHPARLNCGDCAAYALARFPCDPSALQGLRFRPNRYRCGVANSRLTTARRNDHTPPHTAIREGFRDASGNPDGERQTAHG